MMNRFRIRQISDAHTNPIIKLIIFYGITSKWTLHQLNFYQWKTLHSLLQHARGTSSYYSDTLPFNIADLEHFHAEVPILTRQDLQQNINKISCSLLPEGTKITKSIFSTGSTGTPVEVILTNFSEAWYRGCHMRDIAWSQWDIEKHLASIKYFRCTSELLSSGQEHHQWDQWINKIWHTGKSSTMAIETDPRIQYKWLKKSAPNYLLTYPSNLEALLDEMDQQGVIPLESIKTISEPLTPELRARAEKICSVFDTYSSQELGYIASMCHFGRLHIHSEVNFVEILRDDGTACMVGEVGNVVVTNLVNYATPLIRYALGDKASFGHPCPCGAPHPVLGSIEGKIHPLFTLPCGHRKNSMELAVAMRKIGGIKQFQIIQDADGITINLVPSHTWNEDLILAISQKINNFFEASMPLAINQLTRIPLYGGKQRHLVNNLA